MSKQQKSFHNRKSWTPKPSEKMIIILLFLSCLTFALDAGASPLIADRQYDFAISHPISIRHGQPKATQNEISIINSAIRSLSVPASDTDTGVAAKSENTIYLYGKMYSPATRDSSGRYLIVPIIAVQFWVDYGNSSDQYLVVLKRKSKKIFGPTKIGGMDYRFIAIYGMEDNHIAACATFYGPNDGGPNVSVDGIAEFGLGPGNNIREDFTRVNIEDKIKNCFPRP